MQARRAARELAFILFSQFDKKITNYSREDLQDIILKSVRILTSSATEELKTALGGLVAMRDQIENYEADAEENLKRPIGATNIPVPIPMTSDMTGRINDLGRLVKMDKDILRIAIVELLFIKDAPMKVVVDEALELAKKYSTEDSSSFINGVLAKVIVDYGIN